MHTTRILIADDEPEITFLLAHRLTSAGYTVETCSNGIDALEKINQIFPDIVILDIMMPKMDGLEVKRNLNKNLDTMCIPVIFLTAKGTPDDKVKGLHLCVDDYITKPYNADELLARINSILTRKKVYEKVSMTDHLTGVYNVYFFKKQITFFFQMSRRYKKIFSLVIVDIDNFKHINDTYGHLAGDFVLKSLATVTQQTIRETDLVVRYGGDEFVILFPECTQQTALTIMGRINSQIQNGHFIYNEKNIEVPFSISFGCAEYNPEFTSEVHMFAKADENLYAHKTTKKN